MSSVSRQTATQARELQQGSERWLAGLHVVPANGGGIRLLSLGNLPSEPPSEVACAALGYSGGLVQLSVAGLLSDPLPANPGTVTNAALASLWGLPLRCYQKPWD